MHHTRILVTMLCCLGSLLGLQRLPAANVAIDGSSAGRQQTIDGFGFEASSQEGSQSWYQQQAYDDMGASITRIDLTPQFAAPYSDRAYNSPPYGDAGPDGTYCRSYTAAGDYSASWNGASAPIAVMGPDITSNMNLIDWASPYITTQAEAAAAGQSRSAQLGGFKIYGTVFSPSPWLKISSGNSIGSIFSNGPQNAAWPFIWLGNFAGGNLDVSGSPLAQFDDGSGPTSALVQWARTIAAMVKGYQDHFGITFYGLSLQNELNFEEFYSSCSYPLSSQYITMVKAVRSEFNAHPDLAQVQIAGPEDVLGGDAYGMWQYGSGSSVVHKNLQYLQNIAADPQADAAIGFFCVHGYDSNGVTAAGADPSQWQWWVNGWTTSPAAGLPAAVAGFAHYGKKSWMTETSGEDTAWLSPATGFPANGAFSIALKIHQALTAGRESGWLYLSLSDGNPVAAETLTDPTSLTTSPKYVAAKHFYKFIRPNSVRLNAVSDTADLLSSAFINDASGAFTIVLVNSDPADQVVNLSLSGTPAGITTMQSFTSQAAALWQSGQMTVSGTSAAILVPAYGITTLTATAAGGAGGSSTTGTGTGSGSATGTATGGSTGNATAGTTAGGTSTSTGAGAATGSGTGGATGTGTGNASGTGPTTAAPSGSSSGGHCGLGGGLAVVVALFASALAYRRHGWRRIPGATVAVPPGRTGT